MIKKRYLIPIALGAVALGGTLTYSQFAAQDKITLENPQKIEWEKPTTDEAWAEDVKKENFDIKSTSKLTEMKVMHTDKLTRLEAKYARTFDCMECVLYDIRAEHPDWSQAEIDAAYEDALAQATWDIEKLQQSIERMDNELRLREKGFVVVEGEAEPVLGSIMNPYAIRKIND